MTAATAVATRQCGAAARFWCKLVVAAVVVAAEVVRRAVPAVPVAVLRQQQEQVVRAALVALVLRQPAQPAQPARAVLPDRSVQRMPVATAVVLAQPVTPL